MGSKPLNLGLQKEGKETNPLGMRRGGPHLNRALDRGIGKRESPWSGHYYMEKVPALGQEDPP